MVFYVHSCLMCHNQSIMSTIGFGRYKGYGVSILGIQRLEWFLPYMSSDFDTCWRPIVDGFTKFVSFMWVLLIFTQGSYFLGHRQLFKQEVNIHYIYYLYSQLLFVYLFTSNYYLSSLGIKVGICASKTKISLINFLSTSKHDYRHNQKLQIWPQIPKILRPHQMTSSTTPAFIVIQMRFLTRCLKYFVLNTLCSKTNRLRHLINTDLRRRVLPSVNALS